jgi:predicted AAA+ superfamily ATPase
MFTRLLRLPAPGTETFFLWGPRQTGKTTLLRATYPEALWIDLLKAEEYRRYLQNLELLRAELAVDNAAQRVAQIVIDEVQKVPQLLDEVHWLHENRGIQFALCGSSVRKVKRGQANLLGGRAIRYELYGLTASEVGRDFDSQHRSVVRGDLWRTLSDQHANDNCFSLEEREPGSAKDPAKVIIVHPPMA